MPANIEMKQIIPSQVCFSCDVCCRFPEETSFLAPVFTELEIMRAEEAGLKKKLFHQNRDEKSAQIKLIPYGMMCICPCFAPSTGRCKIYPLRPIDCQIYPFALMYDETYTKVVLGVDTKCPFIHQMVDTEASSDYTDYVAEFIESDDIIETIKDNWSLIGRYQDDVIILRRLVKLSAKIKCLLPFIR